MPKEVKEEEPLAAPAKPPPQISVRDWALSQAPSVGLETALAFAALYGQDTGTADQLATALADMCSRVVHQA